jgi:hypothetical protein
MTTDPKPLPDEPISRTIALIKQSSPNPNRPRLPEEVEIRLHDLERESASCYAGLEDASDKFRKIAATIAGGPDDDETRIATADDLKPIAEPKPEPPPEPAPTPTEPPEAEPPPEEKPKDDG